MTVDSPFRLTGLLLARRAGRGANAGDAASGNEPSGSADNSIKTRGTAPEELNVLFNGHRAGNLERSANG